MKKFLVFVLVLCLINLSYCDISYDDGIEQQIESYESVDSSFDDENNNDGRRYQFNIDFGVDVKTMSENQLDEFVKSLDIKMKCKIVDFMANEPTVVILECVDFYDDGRKRRFAAQVASNDERNEKEIHTTLNRGVQCRRINYIVEDVTIDCDDNDNRRISFFVHPIADHENREVVY
ncbi:hypothetical protein PVAND_004650 [Polypedilum vanderplanki]|uniref:Uncharacterized protein n=1 Tax=Polypedilum vanderplanki TaxID=319348 RepID=A0A9J6BY72_POLVA|nr:hypothetical protein PVAND_004650 [Polypedilum vanderplanki]